MAKFTAGVDLNSEWQGHKFVGVAGTTHRLTDALVEEFTEEVSDKIPGFAWVTQDELTSIVTLPIAQTDVTGLTAALAGKYDKTGGTISGAATVTGTLGVQGAATMSAALTAIGATNLSSTLGVVGAAVLNSSLGVVGPTSITSTLVVSDAATVAGAFRAGAAATIIGAANLSSTLGVVGAATFNTTLAVTGKATFSSSIAAGGTSFPGSPASNDLFYRTDHDRWYYYDGTRWLSTSQLQLGPFIVFTAQPYSATAAQALRAPMPSTNGGSDIYIEDVKVAFHVASGGSALGASHKWVATLEKWDSSGATTISSNVCPIDSGTSNVWRSTATDIDAVMGGFDALFVTWTKTGTPGNLSVYLSVNYRIIAT